MARRWWWNLSDPPSDEQVFAFVVRQTDVRRPLRHSDSLLDDLGLDGDDAVAFFQAFEAEFHVDLEPLYRNWSGHFGPEGFPLSAGAIMVVIAAAIGGLAGLSRLPGWIAIGLGLVAALGWLLSLRAWPLNRGKTPTPIVIDDLIRAAQAGRWPVSPRS